MFGVNLVGSMKFRVFGGSVCGDYFVISGYLIGAVYSRSDSGPNPLGVVAGM